MKNKSLVNGITISFLVVALLITGIAVRQNWETRRKAAGEGARIYFDPAEITLSQGETKEVTLYIDTTNTGEKVTTLGVQACLGAGITISNPKEDISLPEDSAFPNILKREIKSIDGKDCLRMVVGVSGSDGNVPPKSGNLIGFKVKIKGIAASGTSQIEISDDPSRTFFYTSVGEDVPGKIESRGGVKINFGQASTVPEAVVGLSPTKLPMKIGEAEEVLVKIDASASGRSINAVGIRLCYDDAVKIADRTKDITIAGSGSQGLSKISEISDVLSVGGTSCLFFYSIVNPSQEGVILPSGAFDMYRIKFTGVKAEEGNIWIDFTNDPDRLNTEISGPCPSPCLPPQDEKFKIGPMEGASSCAFTVEAVPSDEAAVKVALDKNIYNVGDEAIATVSVDTGKFKRQMSTGDFGLCLDKHLAIGNLDQAVTPIKENGILKLYNLQKVNSPDNSDNYCFQFATEADKEQLPSGIFEVAKIKMNAIAAGEGKISWLQDETTKLSGPIAANGDEKDIEIKDYTDASYRVEEIIKSKLIMKFKMTFEEVLATSECAKQQWKTVGVRVMDQEGIVAEDLGASLTPTTTTVVVGEHENKKELQVFEVTAGLVNFQPKGNIFALVKGPMHLYDKYGVDGQSEEYKLYLGKLNGITSDPATTKVFDFSHYPLLAGDVNGDNKMNAADYSKIKTALANGKKEAVTAVDLNGDCILNSTETVIFIKNINEKNGKMY